MSDLPLSIRASPGDTNVIPIGAKIGYGFLAAIGLCGLAVCLVRRLLTIRHENLHHTPFIRWLVICIYAVGMLFIASSTILQYGFGLGTEAYCKTAILLCLTFYLVAKILMYVFLAERARVMRIPLVNRQRDYLWMANLAMIVIGFGIISVLMFVYLVSRVSPADRQCRIGIQLGIAVALLAYDMFINVWLTGLFIKLTSRYISRFFPECISRRLVVIKQRLRRQGTIISDDSKDDDALVLNTSVRSDLAKLARNTVVGSAAMMSSTIINVSVLLSYHSEEPGWVCLLICTIDIIVGVSVIHWVTNSPK